MNPILELYSIGQQIPQEVLIEVDKRIGDWLLSGQELNHPYVWEQVDFAEGFIKKGMNHLKNNCYVKDKTGLIEAEFIGIFQRSNVIDPSPMIGGHPGGVNAYPVAVIKLGGKFKEVKPSEVLFHQSEVLLNEQ